MPTALPARPKRHLSLKDGCYYCGAPAIDFDHVPPRVFFPADDEYRKNLVKVPACEAHNRGFSNDDGIVAGVVASVREATPLGADHFEKTAIPGFRKDRKLAERMMPEVIVYQHAGIDIPVMGIDPDVFDRVMVRIAKGLHFHTWRERWAAMQLAVFCEQLRDDRLTVPNKAIIPEFKSHFFDEPVLGANQRVFHYQWHDQENTKPPARIISLRFFDGLGVYVWGPRP
jgi:hypothetical protein